MLSKSSHPIQFFGGVVDFMKTPQKRELVRKAMPPINTQITEQYHQNKLNTIGQTFHKLSGGMNRQLVTIEMNADQYRNNKPIPQQELPSKEEKVNVPFFSKNRLFVNGMQPFQRKKYQKENRNCRQG